jgi:hypothetical protein
LVKADEKHPTTLSVVAVFDAVAVVIYTSPELARYVFVSAAVSTSPVVKVFIAISES